MELSLMAWPEVATYLAKKQSIIIPIGSTEQHGPMGIIGTDAITAEAIAKRVAEQREVIVAPTIAVGMALHHTEFPGTISLRPSTLIAYLKDYVSSLARNGFSQFLFVNGHGGNIATIQAALAEIYDMAAQDPRIALEINCTLVNWFALEPVCALAETLYGEHEGYHATPSEVSVTWAVYPEVLKDVPFAVPDPIAHPEISSPQAFKRDYPTGVMGANPRLASEADGQKFLEVATEAVSACYDAFVAQP